MKMYQTKKVKLVPPPTATIAIPQRFPWQRLTLSIIGIFFIFLMWKWSSNHLYSLPQYSLATFGSITSSSIYALAALVIWFVTGKLVTELKTGAAASIIETVTDTVSDIGKPIAPKHIDDPAI